MNAPFSMGRGSLPPPLASARMGRWLAGIPTLELGRFELWATRDYSPPDTFAFNLWNTFLPILVRGDRFLLSVLFQKACVSCLHVC